MKERLQKFLAECGIDSRRKCEEYILKGRVKVNNDIITALGTKVDASVDDVYFDGIKVKREENMVYIMLNKPTGYITSLKDERGRKTIMDIVKVNERVFPIGRLDYNTSGLLLITNDGEIYNKIIHPRENMNKVYEAVIRGIPTPKEIYDFENGVDIGGYITSKSKLEIIKKANDKTYCRITIHEGKNRQIRRMCEAINHPVIHLRRVSIGKIKLGSLEMGKYRLLTSEELMYLKSL